MHFKDLSVLNHDWEWFPSPTGWLFCLNTTPCRNGSPLWLLSNWGKFTLKPSKRVKKENLKEIRRENKVWKMV